MNIYRIVLIVLSLISAWLYLRVILPPEPAAQVTARTAPDTTTPASGAGAAPQQASSVAPQAGGLQPLPAEQMQQIIETLAPEWGQGRQ